MARVALENVSKTYSGGVNAVAHFSLVAEDGQFVVLVGPSGCGKTTTLRMIAGLEDPSSGTIRIGERVVNHVAPKDRNIAMVFQNYALYPHMSVYKNMAFALELRYGGGPLARLWKRITNPVEASRLATLRRGMKEQIQRTAQQLGIEPLLARKPAQLSGGEKQRVALGRAIVREPDVFLFDEPLSNLDAQLRVEMRRELKQLHRRLGATMVYVTHDQVEALTLGDRIVVMHRGEIQQVGTPAEVYESPRNKFVASFVGTPPMNFGRGILKETSGKVCVAGAAIELATPERHASLLRERLGQGVTWGIRPEDVRLVSPADGAGRGQVEFVETIGDVSLVYVRLGDSEQAKQETEGPLICKVGREVQVQTGDRVGLVPNAERVHVFATDSGLNLTAR